VIALTLAEDGLAEDAQHLGAVVELHFADAEPRRLLTQDLRQPRGGHRPHLDGDRGAAGHRAHHRRVPIGDRPQAIDGRGARLAHEARASVEQVAVQRQATHQRAVDGEKRGHGARFYAGRRTTGPQLT